MAASGNVYQQWMALTALKVCASCPVLKPWQDFSMSCHKISPSGMSRLTMSSNCDLWGGGGAFFSRSKGPLLLSRHGFLGLGT